MYEYKAKLARVVDGDTFDIVADLGFYVSVLVRVRLARVDAPERFTAAGKRATAFCSQVLAGREFTVRTFKDRKGRYGRYIAEIVFLDGSNLSDLLISNNLADLL